MNRDGRSSSNDPTAEPAADQSTQGASGLSAGDRRTPPRGAAQPADEEIVNRSGPLETPRRYEQPLEEDDDPVMPADGATMNTKI